MSLTKLICDFAVGNSFACFGLRYLKLDCLEEPLQVNINLLLSMASVSYCIYGPLAHKSHDCRGRKKAKAEAAAEMAFPVRPPGSESTCVCRIVRVPSLTR